MTLADSDPGCIVVFGATGGIGASVCRRLARAAPDLFSWREMPLS